MSFCKFSTEYIASSKTELDNIFINDYLPFAQPKYVSVYIYGLYLCSSNAFDNSLLNISRTLNMSEEEIISAYEYWEEQGLVQLLRVNPLEVTYIPLKNVISANKLYKPDKYETFNQQAQDIFKSKRSISKHEYQEYYDFLERYHVEQEALLMIMKYCVETKQSAVGYNYILTVAKNWANEGITSTLQVEERLTRFEEKSPELTEIFNACGIKRSPYIEERATVNKWLNDYGFSLDVILHISKKFKGKNRFSIERADELIKKYYEMKLFSSQEIDDFERDKKELYSLSKEINKELGLYYENLETVVENYILKWINLGFDKNLLLEISRYCFKTSIRTLDGMDRAISKFYKLGLLSIDAFNEYMGEILAIDDKIQSILDTLDIKRVVTYVDRENYKIWKNDWKISDELITYATTLSKGKESPIKYLSRILADWNEKGIKTLQEAKNTSNIEKPNNTTVKKNFEGRSYTDKDIKTLFQSISEIDI